jgi:hypothetical protein
MELRRIAAVEGQNISAGKQTFLSGRHFMLRGFFWNYGALDLIFSESGDIE